MENAMAWFRNFYECAECSRKWTDEWSAMCDDDCPYCGARHMSPYKSDDAVRRKKKGAAPPRREITIVSVSDGSIVSVSESVATATHSWAVTTPTTIDEEDTEAWFRNFYKCAECGRKWTDEWSAMCDDDCPHCGARHMSPYKSTDAVRPSMKRT